MGFEPTAWRLTAACSAAELPTLVRANPRWLKFCIGRFRYWRTQGSRFKPTASIQAGTEALESSSTVLQTVAKPSQLRPQNEKPAVTHDTRLWEFITMKATASQAQGVCKQILLNKENLPDSCVGLAELKLQHRLLFPKVLRE